MLMLLGGVLRGVGDVGLGVVGWFFVVGWGLEGVWFVGVLFLCCLLFVLGVVLFGELLLVLGCCDEGLGLLLEVVSLREVCGVVVVRFCCRLLRIVCSVFCVRLFGVCSLMWIVLLEMCVCIVMGFRFFGDIVRVRLCWLFVVCVSEIMGVVSWGSSMV